MLSRVNAVISWLREHDNTMKCLLEGHFVVLFSYWEAYAQFEEPTIVKHINGTATGQIMEASEMHLCLYMSPFLVYLEKN